MSFSKQHKLPFQQSQYVILKAFELIHINIWGPVVNISIHGLKYFLTVVDDYTRHTWIYLMKSRGETRSFYF